MPTRQPSAGFAPAGNAAAREVPIAPDAHGGEEVGRTAAGAPESRARALLAAGRPAEAVSILEDVMNRLPGHTGVCTLLLEASARVEQHGGRPAQGRMKAAQTLINAMLAKAPGAFETLVAIGGICEQIRDFKSAIAAYEQAIVSRPGHALPFTRRALLKARMEIGDPPAARGTDPAKPYVMMSTLGLNGRFGNQLLQYALARMYAERVGAQVLVPDWIGRDLFGLDDALPGGSRPAATIDDAAVTAFLAGRTPQPRRNVDVAGYFCGQAKDWAAGRASFQRWFKPVGRVKAHADAALAKVLARGRTLVAVHLRHGDYGQGPFWIAPADWYATWLAALWPALEQPVLYVATDDPSVKTAFAAYRPMTAEDLGAPLPGLEFFTDHWIMRHADHLATSNSTFSGTAALLSTKPVRCMRPDRAVAGLRPFEPWAEKVLLD